MKKPRIFIQFHYMELGGAEMALIGLLNAFDTSRVDVDLFINQHTGPLMRLIPSKVNLLPQIPSYSAIERPMKDIIREGHLLIALARLWGKLRYRLYLSSLSSANRRRDGSSTQYIFDAVSPFLPSLRKLGHYDMAISFLDPPHIVQDKVDAAIKLEWIHTDFSTVHMDASRCGMRWANNDYIISISDAISNQFLKTFPTLANKINVIENIISPDYVRQQAVVYDANPELLHTGADKPAIKLLSIGRFALVKNFDSIPDICRRIREQGLDVRWYLVGFGGKEALIREKIAEAGMQDHVIILGKKSNPYPYIKACDIYVQPSRYEGKSITVREAQILCKPVVITNYPSAQSQIKDGVDGVICDMDNASVAEAIIELIKDKDKQKSIVNYLETHDYGFESEVNKIYQILGC